MRTGPGAYPCDNEGHREGRGKGCLNKVMGLVRIGDEEGLAWADSLLHIFEHRSQGLFLLVLRAALVLFLNPAPRHIADDAIWSVVARP